MATIHPLDYQRAKQRRERAVRAGFAKPLPKDKSIPIAGRVFDLRSDPIQLCRNLYDRLGPAFVMKVLHMDVVTLLGPDANQFVLQDKDQCLSSESGWDFYIGAFFKRGLMLRDFDDHRTHRRLMQQAFKKNALVRYLHLMNPSIANGISPWVPTQRSRFKRRVYPLVKDLTLDLATKVFMGRQLGPQANQLNRAFVDTVRAGTALVRYPVPGLAYQKGLLGRRTLARYFREQIPHKRLIKEPDLFSQLCHARVDTSADGRSHTKEAAGEGGGAGSDLAAYSEQDIVDHMIFLMMAAHDTTTIALSMVLYHLAHQPHWQERLREEAWLLDKAFLDFVDLERLASFDWVLKESLRLCPPVPGLPRQASRDLEFDGYRIPKGSLVNVIFSFTHHMEEYWVEPERFDPERFAPARNEHKIHPYAWVPYGGGAHMCIGLHFAELQVKAVLYQLLRRFRWSTEPGYQLAVDWRSLPKPKDGLPLVFERL